MAGEKKQHGKFRQNVSATFGALLLVAGLLLVFSIFRTNDLKGMLLCETTGSAGRQAYVYNFSSRKKTQLYVEGYSDIQRVTGYAGEVFYCCALRGDASYILKVENGKAAVSIPTQEIPQMMTEKDGLLYLTLGTEGSGVLLQLDPATGAQTIVQSGVFTPGGFCMDDKQLLFGKVQNGDVQWIVNDNGKETEILRSDSGVEALALYGGYAYFCDSRALRFFRVSAVTGERQEITTVPLVARAKGEDAPVPVYAFSFTRERQLVLLSNGRTPLLFRSFLIRGGFLYPVVTFGLSEKERTFTSIRWI